MKTLFSTARTTFVAVPALALLLVSNPALGREASDPWEALPKWHFGQSREPLASIEAEIRVSHRQEMEGRLLEILPSPSATKDSKRFICRWLGTVGGENSVPALAALLPDPDLSHPARIALERLSLAAAGKALVDALPSVKGDLLIGVISSIGAKRVEQAVPELAKLAGNSDAAIARAALAGLGQIGNDAAVEALSSIRVDQGLSRDLAQAQISAGNRLAASGNNRAAVLVFERLMSDTDQPPAIKAAAFQGLARTLPDDDRVNFLANALQSEDALLRSSAVKAFAGAGSARETIAARLPGLQPTGQLLLVGILADAPDVAARKPLLAVAQQASDPAVKAAALECLAVHGTAEDVPLVVKSAAAGEAPVKAAAKRTLQRISGEGVDAQFIRLLESPDAAQRAAVLEALPARRMSSALPALTRLVRGTDVSMAADAARTLGEMGGTEHIKELAQVLTSTKNEEVRGATQEAIKSICTRAEDKTACAELIDGELRQAATPEARAALLPLTIYTGGENGFRHVLQSLGDREAEVRDAAFRTLVAWPDARAAGPLLRYAETNGNPNQAVVALRDGCLRLAETEEVPVNDRASILQQVVKIAKRPEEKRRAVSLMGQVPSRDLLNALTTLAADEDLQGEAVAAAVELARGLAPIYPRQSLAALETLLQKVNATDLRQKIETGVKAVRNAGQSREGYILGWLVSGPYTEADKDGSALFNVSFAPEKGERKEANWRPFATPVTGIIDLESIMPGNNRVAYLLATISSEQAQKAVLEMGSDDGLKVWLNDELVHANNAERPCAPGQDKVTVNLKQGDNRLLLKVTQGGGQWAAVVRLVGTEGKPLPSVMVGAAK